MKKGISTFVIPPQFVDFKTEILLSSLIDLIITASGTNADENGFGMNDLNKIGGTWVMTRLAMEIKHTPKQYEKITLETWVEEVHTLNTIRNFRIKNEQGETIGEAISVWMMINVERRRPMELSLLEGIEEHILEESTSMENPLKLDNVEGEAIMSFNVKYSDIDINQHVNTRNYIQWMLDTFSLEDYKKGSIKRMDLNFVSEIVYGSEITVFKTELHPQDFRFEIRANDRLACKGRVKF